MTERKCVIDETISCDDFKCENCPVKDAYNYGLAEGRKEQEKNDKGFCKNVCMKGGKITELEKENEQLKAEIKQIIERERVVPEHYLCEMIEKNKELKAQIEKMKCCTNCKHNNYTYWQSHCNNPKVKICKLLMQKEEVICANYDKWELKE